MITTERARISRLFDAAEACRDYPGEYFPKLGQARKALAAWRAANPAEAAAEDAEKAASAEARKRRIDEEAKYSFIARGLD